MIDTGHQCDTVESLSKVLAVSERERSKAREMVAFLEAQIDSLVQTCMVDGVWMTQGEYNRECHRSVVFQRWGDFGGYMIATDLGYDRPAWACCAWGKYWGENRMGDRFHFKASSYHEARKRIDEIVAEHEKQP
jgi:hypothetical protein